MKSIKANIHALLWLAVLAGALYQPKWDGPSWRAVLTFDPAGYYSYLPGLFIYKDLKTASWVGPVEKKLLVGLESSYVASPTSPQNRVQKYPCGMAVMEAPFFLAAHVSAKILGFEADGFSKPYQMAVAAGGLLMAFLGLYFSRKSLRHYFSENTTVAALTLLALGTNWYHYARFDYAHTHIWLFALLAALIWCSIKYHERPSLKGAAWIGLLSGLSILTRPTEVFVLLVPLFWGMPWTREGLSTRFLFFKENWRQVAAAGAMVALLLFPQLLYWKMTAGQWLFYSYPGQTFSFLHPHLRSGLFSFRKGWLVWTPAMVFALFGLVSLFKLGKGLGQLAVVYTALTIWVVFSWDIWWYGGSFGQRAMVQSYALLAFPMAAFMEFGLKTEARRTVFALFAVFFLLLNQFQSWQGELTGLGLDAENTTRAFYQRMFLRFHPDRNDLKLLDGEDDFGNQPRQAIATLFSGIDWAKTDSSVVDLSVKDSGTRAIRCDGSREFIPLAVVKPPAGAEWVRATGQFFMANREWDTWKSPSFVVEAKDSAGKVVRSAYHKPMRHLDEWCWQEISFDLKIEGRPVESVEIYLYQPVKGSQPLWLRDLRVEAFQAWRE